MTKTQTQEKPSVIRLTRLKQWYIPADTDTYLALRAAGVPLLKIHKDFLPTLEDLLLPKRRYVLEQIPFEDLLNSFLDKVGFSWNKRENHRCTLTASSLRFEVTKPESFDSAKELIPKLQLLLETFFSRWCFGFTFDLTITKTRLRFTAEYWFDSNKTPVIQVVEALEESPKIQLKLGFTRISLSLGDKFVDLLIEVSQGGVYKPLYTSRCLYSQVSSVKPFIKALCLIPSRDPSNFDNPVD